MEETREERIERLPEEFRKLLEDKFPNKGSTLARIEELTEEIGKMIEERIEDAATKQEGTGSMGRHAMRVWECCSLRAHLREGSDNTAWASVDSEGILPLRRVRQGFCSSGCCNGSG